MTISEMVTSASFCRCSNSASSAEMRLAFSASADESALSRSTNSACPASPPASGVKILPPPAPCWPGCSVPACVCCFWASCSASSLLLASLAFTRCLSSARSFCACASFASISAVRLETFLAATCALMYRSSSSSVSLSSCSASSLFFASLASKRWTPAAFSLSNAARKSVVLLAASSRVAACSAWSLLTFCASSCLLSSLSLRRNWKELFAFSSISRMSVDCLLARARELLPALSSFARSPSSCDTPTAPVSTCSRRLSCTPAPAGPASAPVSTGRPLSAVGR
mmetsp:Transcript_81020/g.262498  ORF Transcript_81020/g.262498 Transcript_81020/m.262498 type:complete len:284 (+) Transcript_81020:1060-1911(+)